MTTTGFSGWSWEARHRHLGDDAEAVFRRDRPTAARFGLERPDFSVGTLPLKLRYTPDFVDQSGLWEVMVVGRDRRLKLKMEKHMSLCMWHGDMDTWLWVYDWSAGECGHVSIPNLTEALADKAEVGRFPEGKRTWEIPVTELGVEWHDATRQ